MATVVTPPATSTRSKALSTASVPHPRPWLKWISLVLVIAGLADSIYLTYSHVAGIETVCPAGNPTFNCDLVQHSIYSFLAGIPIVYLGLGGYLALLIVLLLDGRVTFFTERGALIAFGLSLFGFLYSGYLTSIEAFVLHAWCMWCMGSAIAMTFIFGLSAARVWRKIGTVPDLDDLEISDDAE